MGRQPLLQRPECLQHFQEKGHCTKDQCWAERFQERAPDRFPAQTSVPCLLVLLSSHPALHSQCRQWPMETSIPRPLPGSWNSLRHFSGSQVSVWVSDYVPSPDYVPVLIRTEYEVRAGEPCPFQSSQSPPEAASCTHKDLSITSSVTTCYGSGSFF